MSGVDRTALPRPGENPPFHFPRIDRAALANGLQLWTIPIDGLPIVSVLLLIEAGSALDPPDAHGLASLTGDMLDEGSDGRSALEMHEALAALGAQFETEVGSDATVLGLTLLSRHLHSGLRLLGDIAVRPRLAPDDFERVRQLRLHRLRQLRDQPSASADRAFLERVYGDHPYGHLAVGSDRSLQDMTPDLVCAFHAAAYQPRRATLIAAGELTPETLIDAAREAFDDWRATESASADTLDLSARPVHDGGGVFLVPRPGAAQSELRIGHVGVSRSTPDFHALLVLNMVLGGQFISRVNLNLRERKGYTYGARTSFEFRRGRGPFLLQTAVQTRVTADAIGESIGEIEGLRGSRAVTAEELQVAQAALTRGYARNFETAEQICRAALQLAIHRLPDDYYDSFVPLIDRISADEVTAAAVRHLDPARLTTVIVGDAEAVTAPVEAAGLGTPQVLAL